MSKPIKSSTCTAKCRSALQRSIARTAKIKSRSACSQRGCLVAAPWRSRVSSCVCTAVWVLVMMATSKVGKVFFRFFLFPATQTWRRGRSLINNATKKNSAPLLTWLRLPASARSNRVVTSFDLFLTSNGTNCAPRLPGAQAALGRCRRFSNASRVYAHASW